MNEQLIRGREDSYFGYELVIQARKKLPDDVVDYYVRLVSNPEALRGSLGFYRALDTTIAQDRERASRRLTLPVPAIGGAASFGDHVGEAVSLVADDVRSAVIADTGHFLAEECPDELLATLTPFLAEYRDGAPTAHGARQHAAAAS